MNVGIYSFDQMELLDFAGPFEVFTTASRVAERQGLPAPFHTFTLSAQLSTVQARAGLTLQSDFLLHKHPTIDLLIIPGGVVNAELDRQELIQWLQHQRTHCPIIASVCTGAFILAEAGLLDGLQATTHWEDLDDLRHRYPAVEVLDTPRYVDQQHTLTSAGIAAGIDLSLYLVARLTNPILAQHTARQMDYPWTASE